MFLRQGRFVNFGKMFPSFDTRSLCAAARVGVDCDKINQNN